MKQTAAPALRSLVFALLASTLTPVAGATAPSNPVDYPDAIHVPNGCYLSAITFLKRYAEENPDEQTRILGFAPRGWGGGHFVALITWQGKWWIRDEYFGVCPVGQKVGAALNPAKLDQRAANTFDRYTAACRKAGQMPSAPWLVGKLTEVQKADSVVDAAALVPFKSEQFCVKCGDKELTFLFFRPAAGRIAVYEPSHGTAIAVCAEADVAVVVAAVATRFGYTIASVRPAFSSPGAMLAAN